MVSINIFNALVFFFFVWEISGCIWLEIGVV